MITEMITARSTDGQGMETAVSGASSAAPEEHQHLLQGRQVSYAFAHVAVDPRGLVGSRVLIRAMSRHRVLVSNLATLLSPSGVFVQTIATAQSHEHWTPSPGVVCSPISGRQGQHRPTDERPDRELTGETKRAHNGSSPFSLPRRTSLSGGQRFAAKHLRRRLLGPGSRRSHSRSSSEAIG